MENDASAPGTPDLTQTPDSGQPVDKPALFEVVINGERKTVPAQELIAGYQQNTSYTQKSQALAARAKKIDEEIRTKATEMYLQALKEKEENISSEEETPESQYQKKIQELESKLNNFEQTTRNKEIDSQFKKMLDTLKGKYDKMNPDMVAWRFYKEAKDDDDVSEVLERLAKETHEAEATREKTIIDSYIKSKMKNPLSKGETGHSTNPPLKAPEMLKTFEEARARAEARLRGE